MKLSILPGLATMVTILACGAASAEWQADPQDKLEVRAETAVAAFKARVPRSNTYFDDAYGFAIYPSVTRIGFGFGGAYGKGVVIAADDSIGTSSYKQFTSGIQAGARNFSMIVFFKDKQALEYFQTGKTQFMGQAGIAVGTFGAAGTPAYNDGVAVITLTRMGLMGEFTVSGAKFSFRPAPKP
jgi:lipid-binding SYLF domain-containing protein